MSQNITWFCHGANLYRKVHLGAPRMMVCSRVRLTPPSPYRCNVKIGVAYEKRAELRFPECPKELREPTIRNIKFHPFFVVAVHLHRDITQGNCGPGRLYSCPFSPLATINTLAYG